VNRNFLIIINPAAGKATFKAKYDRIVSHFSLLGFSYETFYTTVADDQSRLQDKIKLNTYDDVIVLGGDGTLNYVVNGMVESNIPISVISNGTGNDALRSIHHQFDLEKQIDIATNGEPKILDLGKCNTRYFLNGVGLGFDGAVVDTMIRRGKRYAGHWAYMSTVLELLFKYKSVHFKADIDNILLDRKLFSMTIGNGTTFGGGFQTNPRAKMDDGLLDLMMIHPANMIQRPLFMLIVMMAQHGNFGFTTMQKAKEIKIEKTPGLKAHIDGELLPDGAYQIKIVPGAISFRMP
jgi:diacylglycerol kinase (ATP)